MQLETARLAATPRPFTRSQRSIDLFAITVALRARAMSICDNATSFATEDRILQVVSATTGGLSLGCGVGLALLCWTARLAKPRPSHEASVLLIVGWLGTFDAVYGASFVVDAVAVCVPRSAAAYGVLDSAADFLFAYGTCTSLLSATLAWYLHRALVWASPAEAMHGPTLRHVVLATLVLPVAFCAAFAAAFGHPTVSYWLQLVGWIVVVCGSLAFVAAQFLRIQLHYAAVLRSATELADAEASPPSHTVAIATSLHRRLSSYMLVYLVSQGASLVYYAWGGHYQLDLRTQPRGRSVPFALAVTRVATQPLAGFANACVYVHHARRPAARLYRGWIVDAWRRSSRMLARGATTASTEELDAPLAP